MKAIFRGADAQLTAIKLCRAFNQFVLLQQFCNTTKSAPADLIIINLRAR